MNDGDTKMELSRIGWAIQKLFGLKNFHFKDNRTNYVVSEQILQIKSGGMSEDSYLHSSFSAIFNSRKAEKKNFLSFLLFVIVQTMSQIPCVSFIVP